MSHPAMYRLGRIVIGVCIAVYALMVILFGYFSWLMADERRRVDMGPRISAIVGPTRSVKAGTMGEVSYSIASPAGTIECREEIDLGPTNLDFHRGQVIEVVAGDRCGRAVSIHKLLFPRLCMGLTALLVLFPSAAYAWERRKRRKADR